MRYGSQGLWDNINFLTSKDWDNIKDDAKENIQKREEKN